MGPFYKPSEPTETQYYTETGLSNAEYLNRPQEISQEQFTALRDTLRGAAAIYCPFSLRTGEPYLYMDVLKDAQGYGFTRSRIQIWTETENARLAPQFAKPDVEVVRIPAGEDGQGIPTFLGMAFYENGAEFAEINGTGWLIAAEDILPSPDLSRIPENRRPILNPELFRWQCHLAQLTGQENPLISDLDSLYLDKLGAALLSARVLLPLLAEDPEMRAGSSFTIPAWKGRGDREYVRIFSDWRRLYKGMDDKHPWSAKTERVAGLIESYDLALNNSSFRDFGLYIDQRLYEMLSGKQNT